MADRSEFRVAVLGTGAIAQVVHLPVLSTLDGVRIHALCDQDRPRAQAIASRFGVPNVPRGDEEVFGDAEVDGVIICTPNHLHEAQAIAALDAGKHVLVEKPLALTPEGAERVIAAAQRAGRTLMVALNNRYRPDAIALRPFVKGGELGTPFFVKAGWLNRKMRVLRPTWRHRRATAGGGALMDLGLQVIDLSLWMLDNPRVERVVAQAHPGESMEVEDSAAVMLFVEGGLTVSVEVTWSYLHQRDRHYFQVLGTHGSGSLPPLTVFKEVEHGLLDVSPQIAPGRENIYTASYRQELQLFAAAGRGEQEVELPRDQVELMRLIGLAYRSIEEKREIGA